MFKLASTAALTLLAGVLCFGREAKLVRYPHYHNGRIAFSYLGDVWTADDNGANVQRITANAARDVYPRFSPDGKWIAFSSDRNGNLDVYVVPSEGGQAKQLTFHSADDSVLAWSPDSRNILFSSQRGEDFMGKLYVVPVEGGMEMPAGPDMGVWGSYSPDGSKLAINRRSQVYWRKYYRGAYQSDVTVMDLASKKFTDLTDFAGMDSWPMWSRDGHVYFVSDREGNGLTNIWRVSEKGGKAERVTSFTSGDVRWPGISSDGKTIVFEHDFGVWKLDLPSKKATAIKINIAAETQDNMSEVCTFAARADDFDLAPSGKRIALSIHGEIFSAPVDEGDVRQVTDNPARDREVRYSPDGKWMAFVSDRSGREEIFVAPVDGSADAKRITDIDALKNAFRWSPDSKQLVFATSDAKLYKVAVTGGATTELASSKFGSLSGAVWSPDGKWIAYSKADATRNSHIYLIPAAGGQERRATFDSSSEMNPRFSADGKKLYFVRLDGNTNGPFGSLNAQVYVTMLEKQDRDPDDAEDRPEPAAEDTPGPGARRAQPAAIKDVNIDWAGLKRRTSQITRLSSSAFTYEPAPDSKTIAFVTAEPGSLRSTPTIYTIQDDGKKLARVATGGAPTSGESADGPPERGGRFGGGSIQGLNFARDGRTLFFMEAGSIYSVPITSAVAGTAARAPAAAFAGGSDTKKRINFTVRVKVEKFAEWAEMFGDAWRTMKYRFYDPKMHGMDWDAVRSKYQPLVEYVGDRQELLNIVNEMIGELNASHTGAAPPAGAREGAAATRHLGMDFEADTTAGRYKISYIYEEGPADKDWVNAHTGDFLIAIDGKPVTASDNYWKLLNNPLNRRVTLRRLEDAHRADYHNKFRRSPLRALGKGASRHG